MPTATTLGPNWLVVLSAAYAMTAFFFLGFAVLERGAYGASAARPLGLGRQRAACLFAAAAGMLASALQAVGQFLHFGEGEPMVILMLALIPLLVGFVVMSDRGESDDARSRDADSEAGLAMKGGRADAVTSLLPMQRRGEAAE